MRESMNKNGKPKVEHISKIEISDTKDLDERWDEEDQDDNVKIVKRKIDVNQASMKHMFE